jgi:hypothetical protein
MISKFYNNVFASAYHLYSKYYPPPRATFRSIVILALHIMGLLFLCLAIAKRAFVLDLSQYQGALVTIIIGVFALMLIQLTKNYSKKRTDAILNEFRSCPSKVRRVWGFITITTLLLEYIALAFLLSK